MIFDGAKWISNGVREYVGTESSTNGVQGNPAPYFRKEFKVSRGLVKATLYASAKGMYEAYVNDSYVSDSLFNPGFTNYSKLIQYQEYDVTDKLRKGKNVLGAVVAEGWYAGRLAFKKERYFGTWPVCLLMKLVLEYKNGTMEEIVTDSSFITSTGRILATDILDGEVVDNRLPESFEMFSRRIDTDGWQNAVEEGEDFSLLVKQEEEPVRYLHRLKGVRIGRCRGDIYDFGQNAAGVVFLNVKASEGAKIIIRHGEMMDGGSLYTANLRLAKCEDVFYCRSGRQILTPTFTFHGFRYAEIIVEDGVVELVDVFMNVCHNDLDRTGLFDSSSELINKIYNNALWGQRSNFISIPTDCPQRDERLGWTGDAQIFSTSAMYNADCSKFFRRYMRDLRLDMRADGAVTDIVPHLEGLTGAGTAAWGDAVCVIPYNHYRMYGDKTILEENIDAMERWIAYLKSSSTELIRGAEGYGDWLSVGEETDKAVLATAYFARSTYLTAECLDILGKDSSGYRALFEDIKAAFANAFVDGEGKVKSDTQTCYLLMLEFGLCADEMAEKRCFAHLINALERNDDKLTTGFVGVSLLLPVLCRYGRADLAYKLILSTEYPSWGFSVVNGATTIWERWNSYTPEGFGDVGMNSFNHYSLGSCVEWMYGYMLGIRPLEAGFKKVLIAPVTDPLHRVSFASGGFYSAHGRIDVDWTDDDGAVTLTVIKPAELELELDIKGEIASVSVDGEQALWHMIPYGEEISVTYKPYK